MPRVKNLHKICLAMFSLAAIASFILPVQAVTVQWSISNANTRNTSLKNYFFLENNAKVDNAGIHASYYDGSTWTEDPYWTAIGVAGLDYYAAENTLALKAFEARKRVNNDNLMVDWASDVKNTIYSDLGTPTVFPRVYYLSKEQKATYSNYYYAMTQFMIMEAMGEYASTFQNDQFIQGVRYYTVDVIDAMAGNFTYEYNPTAPTTGMKVWSSCVFNSGTDVFAVATDPLSHDWKYPLANESFWASIGFARLGITVRGTSEDVANYPNTNYGQNTFGDNCTAVAEESFVYPELLCYDPTFGLYAEHFMDTSDVFQLRTQALAILACSRLYQATQKQFYIERANSLIDSIAKYFIVGVVGAGVLSVDLSDAGNASRSAIIEGYGNAMLAMALGDLYSTTGNAEYARMSQDVVTFFNTYMWDDSVDVDGYCEFFNSTALARASYGSYAANAKTIATNSMVFAANEYVMNFNKTFWDLYGFWVILWSVIAAAVVVVVALIVRKRNMGTKLSKTVRGLITEA